MPRKARLDIPGILQHVIVRGVEKRDIFVDDRDRDSFLRNFSELLEETGTDCLAWVLIPNHVHLLLRPNRRKLAFLMRRLLTRHAITFNLRHQRSGHLFQNRYKSIVCEEDLYLLELVRYIHLNPIRAGLLKEMNELDDYAWSGHSVLMGNRKLSGQKTHEVLAYFGKPLKEARCLYRKFVMDGISQGRREELVGGGLRRSMELAGLPGEQAYDERVLGSGGFVEQLRQEKELSDRLPVLMAPHELVKRIAHFFGIEPEVLKQRNRSKPFTDVRGIISYFAVREMGHNGEEVGRLLNISRSAVSLAAGRGEDLIKNDESLRAALRELINN
jgi:REP element-mobilizing transposase RayT